MTHERNLDRLLDTWFADGPVETPDRVLDDVTARIHRQPQRPAWRLALRESPVNAYLKPLAAIAAVIAIAVVGLYLVREPGGVAAPAPTPSPTVAPTASPSPSPSPSASQSPVAVTCDDGTTTSCAGTLAPGEHSSVAFQPGLTFTADTPWTNTFDIARTYNLRPVPRSFDVQVLSQLAIPEQNAECSPSARTGAGNTVADWVEFITTHPGLTVAKSTPVAIAGHEGQQIQFHVAADWTERCPDSIGPAVVVFTDSNTPPQRAVWFDDHRVTVWLLDVDGATVAIHLDSGPSTNINDADVQAFLPVLESMSFAPAP